MLVGLEEARAKHGERGESEVSALHAWIRNAHRLCRRDDSIKGLPEEVCGTRYKIGSSGSDSPLEAVVSILC